MEIDMTNLTPAQIADAYAAAKARADAAAKELDALKKLVDATGMAELVGETFTLKVNIFERAQFDAATAKTFLTPAQIETATKTIDVRTITVKASLKIAAA
jgi:hypothetical protein